MIDFLVKFGPMIVLPLFLAVFLGFGFWAYRPSNKKAMDDYGNIPFKESRDGHE
jgi:cbb3-type cytochrome oxidase subunit 3